MNNRRPNEESPALCLRCRVRWAGDGGLCGVCDGTNEAKVQEAILNGETYPPLIPRTDNAPVYPVSGATKKRSGE